MRKHKKIKQIIIYCFAIFVFVYVMFPLYTVLLTSVQYDRDMRTRDIAFIPNYVTFDHFKSVLEPGHIVSVREATLTSLFVSVSAGFFSCLVAVFASFALSRSRLKYGHIILYALVSIYILPVVLFLLPLFVLVVRLGLQDRLFVIILLYTAFILPFIIWVLKAFVEAIPVQVEYAALVDGCNFIQIFYKIYLPLIKPGIVAGFLVVFILSWIEFMTPLIFTNRIKMLTVELGLYRTTTDINIGEMAAAAIIAMIPVIIVTTLFSRNITQVLMGHEK